MSEPTQVTLCEDGPMLVRGEVVVEDEDGQRHVSSRPVRRVPLRRVLAQALVRRLAQGARRRGRA